MKTKIVGILVCMLLIATALPAVGTMTEKEIPMVARLGDNSVNHQSITRDIVDSSRGGMFIQLPHSPGDSGLAEWASEPDRQIIEDFWEIPSPICDIHWWGEYLLYEGGVWYFLDPELMRVNISFYENDNGQPGALVSSYINVKPSVTETGIWYDWGDPFLWQMYYFEYDFDPCITLYDGWVSISSVASSDNGWLMWIISPDGNGEFLRDESGNLVPYPYDVALVLTDGEPATPDLECDGSLSWTDVPPGSNVTGDFVIRNNGNLGSVLHWNISSYPTDWGTNWTFTPYAGFLTTDMEWIPVNVSVEAPPEKNKEFTGTIKVINTFDSSDYCEIPVTLITPKNKAFNFNFNLLSWLFERFPNAFPILRYLLGL